MKPNKRTKIKHFVKPMLASEVAKARDTVCRLTKQQCNVKFDLDDGTCQMCIETFRQTDC